LTPQAAVYGRTSGQIDNEEFESMYVPGWRFEIFLLFGGSLHFSCNLPQNDRSMLKHNALV